MRWLIAFAAVIGFGCECGDRGTLGRLEPEIEVVPAQIAFGEVPIGASKRVALTVRNAGTAKLVITSAIAGAPFRAETSTLEIAPGDNTLIDLVFKPDSDQPASGTLVIVSDAVSSPELAVPLSGQGVIGVVEITPLMIEFSSTVLGASRSAEIVIHNRGIEPISGQIVPEQFTRPEHFRLTGLGTFAPGPYGAPARGDANLDLDYQPLAIGDDNGRIIFELCGPRCGIEVQVIASAVAATVRLEPAVVEMGDVGIGETKSVAVTVFNDGSQPLIVEGIRTSGGAELSAATARALPQTLQPGSTLAIDVMYRPTAATELAGELVVATSDQGVREARARVTGRGIGPLFEVQPESIEFGAQRRIMVHRRAFLLLNSGSAEVRVESVRISGDAQFALDSVPGLPARLAGGESIAPYVTFTPNGTLGEFGASVEARTSDPQHAMVTIPVSAGFAEQVCDLEVSPGRVNFGLVQPGYRREQTISLTNRGDDPCRIVSGDFRAPVTAAIQILPVTFPLQLDPGQSAQMRFVYAPTDRVESKTIYVLQTDDPVLPERLIALVGSAEGYDDLFVRPTDVDFGTIRPGCAVRGRQVTVFNSGVLSVLLDRVTLTSTSSEIVMRPLPQPLEVPAGGSYEVTLDYLAADLGTDSGELQIAVHDRPYNFIVPLRGAGASVERITDTFQQREDRAVDVLFVVDNSCSMEDEQLSLAANFNAFIRAANLRQVDFRIGVTTTTVDSNGGALVGAVITPTTNNLESVFRNQVNVGVGGSGFEQGLEAMSLALSRFRLVRPASREMLRQDASFVVIIVTDEDDSSPAPVLTYFSDLTNSSPNEFLTATVSGQFSGCTSADGSRHAFPGPKYEQFTALTRGISTSICDDWAMNLGNIGSAAFGLLTRFSLSNNADSSEPIEVRVDGVVVPPGAWIYDAPSNSIIFQSSSVPPERSNIEVSYSPAC